MPPPQEEHDIMLLAARRIIELYRITGATKEELKEVNTRAIQHTLANGTPMDAELERKIANINRMIDEVYAAPAPAAQGESHNA